MLVRAVATPSQTELDAPARRANVRDAFRLRRPDLIAGRHVLLVDDILTTGATLSECARCLREGGAAAVGVADGGPGGLAPVGGKLAPHRPGSL